MAVTRDPFEKQQYISLETYRKNGQAVRTPVWFARENGALYVWTYGGSGKVKRIRGNKAVKVAPSDVSGKALGAYVSGEAQVAPKGTPGYEYGNRLVNKKYGFLKKLFEWMGRKNQDQQAIIKINIFM